MRILLALGLISSLAVAAAASEGGVDVTVISTPAAEPTATPACRAGGEQQRLSVSVQPPEGSNISTAVFDFTYDATAVGLPGSRNEESVRDRIGGFPEGAVTAVNDRNGELRVVVTGTKALPTAKPLFAITFDVCAGATAPELDGYTCKVDSCIAMSTPVEGCTCRLELEKVAAPATGENAP